MDKYNKFASRKFQVYLTWLAFAVACMFFEGLPKDIIFQFFGFVSVIYIGGNVAQKYIDKGGNGKIE